MPRNFEQCQRAYDAMTPDDDGDWVCSDCMYYSDDFCDFHEGETYADHEACGDFEED